MGMDDIRKILQNGVKTIISRHSPPGSQDGIADFPSSTHPQREICFVVEGLSRYMFNGSVYDARPGTVFLIDRWEPHGFGYRKEDRDLLHLWIQNHSKKQLSAHFMRVGVYGQYRIERRKIILPPEFFALLTRRWDALNAAGETVSRETVMEYMKLPLNFILDEVLFQWIRKNADFSSPKLDPLIDAVKKYILMSNARDCSYRQLEQISGYNRFYLAHRFRESEGCTIGEFINRVRIIYSADALRHGMMQKEIAIELGFSSASNFWNWFRKHKTAIQEEVKRFDDNSDPIIRAMGAAASGSMN